MFKDKSEIKFDELNDLVRLTKETLTHSYKTEDKYPLLAIVNSLRPWKVELTNLAD